jgi:hypothetical protein
MNNFDFTVSQQTVSNTNNNQSSAFSNGFNTVPTVSSKKKADDAFSSLVNF